MKILTLDIETSPHEGYSFQVWQTNIAPVQIITPTTMLTWSAKWLDSKRKPIVRTWTDEDFHELLADLLNEADLVVSYNGDKFDMRHVKRELVERGYFPLRPIASVDMLKVVKKHFNFPHNRLDYVAQRILGETKLETGGFELWPAFMRGEKDAVRLMKKYNAQDVVLTEKLYLKLRPWITNHPFMIDVSIDFGDQYHPYQCPVCQSHHVGSKAQRRTRCYAIRQVQCGDCGHWYEGKRKKVA